LSHHNCGSGADAPLAKNCHRTDAPMAEHCRRGDVSPVPRVCHHRRAALAPRLRLRYCALFALSRRCRWLWRREHEKKGRRQEK
jgi:hypothetical protein